MNTNSRKTDIEGRTAHATRHTAGNGNQVNGEGAQASASAGVEIPLSDTAADLHAIQIFLGMSANRLQALWDLCRGENRAFYRQHVALLADITRTMHRPGRTS